ncbi:MAG: hypothetical protein M0Z41_09600 [Peptococcaceae bacterium]|jgi:hypothetical protein|nr:hypothetical protein [Peptococcaceae bacterium]
MSDSFQVVLISPPGYVHSAALAEIIETLVYGLRGLGLRVTREKNRIVPGPRAVVLGAHLLPPARMELVPAETIVYNLEQVDPESPVWTPAYYNLVNRLEVWDYSRRNIERLAAMEVAGLIRHVPIGYVPELTRIAPGPEDIDVLFYGSLNERRVRVIRELESLGLNVQAVFGVYGEKRDALIARSKVVLNLHYYDSSVFEVVRISYLLANSKAVVSEYHPGTEIDEDLLDAVRLAPYGELARAVLDLVGDERERRELAARGFERMRARDEVWILKSVLAQRTVQGGT